MILIVDDSPFARAALERALLARGVVCTAVASSEEVVDEAKFVGAVLDVEIGQQSGVELARHLRARSPQLPLAFLTATSELADAAATEGLGPVFDKRESLEAVVEWCVARARG